MVAVKRRAEGGVVRIEVIVAIDGFAKWVKSRILGHLQTNRLGQQRGFVSKPDLREIGMEWIMRSWMRKIAILCNLHET